MAHPVPALAAHGRDRHLYPTAAAGDADLPGHQGQGADVEQSVARGVLESEHQIRADRERRSDRRGSSVVQRPVLGAVDRKSRRLNSSHSQISYAVFCLKKKKKTDFETYTGKLADFLEPKGFMDSAHFKRV